MGLEQRHPSSDDTGWREPQGRQTAVSRTPRPTGIDEDGLGQLLYVASWKGAVFSYAGPNVGYIAQITPIDNQSAAFPDLQKASDDRLLELLASPSSVWRLAVQREILRRSAGTSFAPGLEQLALTHENLAVRVAAIFTLNQLLGAKAQDSLFRLAKYDQLRPFTLKALADRKPDAANLPTTVFTDALVDDNPAVRLQAVIALNRLGRNSAIDAILPCSQTPILPGVHVAFRSRFLSRGGRLHAQGAGSIASGVGSRCCCPSANLHDARVVDGLISRIHPAEAPSSVSRPILDALCRLYYREADWDGSWWGTRPDTSGPYFKPVTWDQSGKIGATFKNVIFATDDETLGFLLEKFVLYKINLPDLLPKLIQIAGQKPLLRPMVVDLVANNPSLSNDAIALLKNAVLDPCHG